MNFKISWVSVLAGVVLAVAPLFPAMAQTAGEPIVVTDLNDVMGGKLPQIPSFPKLAKRPGFLRGYVRDTSGRPLQGANILVIPPALFGSSRTSVAIQGKTDANGLYEISIPVGGGRVWCAGYALTDHGIRLALPLHPADGELGTIARDTGDIENFVLLPYGVASPSKVSENPVYNKAYYGASFTIGYFLSDPTEAGAPPRNLPEGAEIEITMTPDGPLIDGSKGRSLTIRKTLKSSSYFQVNDIPIGRYQIRAQLRYKGKTEPLHLKDNSRNPSRGGLEPKETDGAAAVQFRSESADPATIRVPGGNMERLSLLVERISPVK